MKRLTDRAYANAKTLLVREEARLHALSRELLDKCVVHTIHSYINI